VVRRDAEGHRQQAGATYEEVEGAKLGASAFFLPELSATNHRPTCFQDKMCFYNMSIIIIITGSGSSFFFLDTGVVDYNVSMIFPFVSCFLSLSFKLGG